jgi:protein-tyrosine phosphatase
MDSDLSSEDESEDEVNAADVDEGTEALAMQFYRIELAEQRRLLGVMQHHSKESGPSGLSDPQLPKGNKGAETLDHPFSITAGIEKGAKNR